MILKLVLPILIILSAGIGGEIYLRHSNWSDTNLIEGWGRILKARQADGFAPHLKIQTVGQIFATNESGERYPLQSKPKTPTEVRIGLFGGVNVLGFGLPEKHTLIHFMKINPASACELQGRLCTYYSYGRISSSIQKTSELIRRKIQEDNLDIVVWLVDPSTNKLNELPKLPLTSSLAANWILNPIAEKKFQKIFKFSGDFLISEEDQTRFNALRQTVFEKQLDLVPVIMPSFDLPLSPQSEWERKSADFFMTNGFLPLRGKRIFSENDRTKQQLYTTGLMNSEALRALASFIKERLQRAPKIIKIAR